MVKYWEHTYFTQADKNLMMYLLIMYFFSTADSPSRLSLLLNIYVCITILILMLFALRLVDIDQLLGLLDAKHFVALLLIVYIFKL